MRLNLLFLTLLTAITCCGKNGSSSKDTHDSQPSQGDFPNPIGGHDEGTSLTGETAQDVNPNLFTDWLAPDVAIKSKSGEQIGYLEWGIRIERNSVYAISRCHFYESHQKTVGPVESKVQAKITSSSIQTLSSNEKTIFSNFGGEKIKCRAAVKKGRISYELSPDFNFLTIQFEGNPALTMVNRLQRD